MVERRASILFFCNSANVLILYIYVYSAFTFVSVCVCVFIHLDYTIKPRLSPTQTSNCTKAKNPKSNRIFYYNPNRKSHARTYTLFQKLTHGENFVKERKNNELLIKCSRVWGVCVCSWVDCWYDWERIWQMPNDGWMCECVWVWLCNYEISQYLAIVNSVHSSMIAIVNVNAMW